MESNVTIKQRISAFFVFVILITGIAVGSVIYMKVLGHNADIWTAKAQIAQVQPEILIAQGQKNINNAVAFSIAGQSVMINITLLALLAVVIVFVARAVLGVKYEKF